MYLIRIFFITHSYLKCNLKADMRSINTLQNIGPLSSDRKYEQGVAGHMKYDHGLISEEEFRAYQLSGMKEGDDRTMQ